MGFPQRKASFGGALSPRKRLAYSLRPAFEDATDGKEKNHASAGCRVSRSLAHLSSTVLDPRCRPRSICCPFFSRLSHDGAWRYKLCFAVVFEMYGLLLRLLSCIYRASAIGVTPNPPRCQNVGNGRSLVVAPALCIQLVSANQYVRKTTKQCVNTTAKQHNSKTVTSVSTSVSQYFSQYFSQSVLTSISQSAFLNKTPCGPSFLIGFVPDVGFGNGWFASSDWPANKRERDVIFDPFLSPRNIICFGTRQAVFSVTRNILGNENSLPARGWKTPPKSSFFTGHPMCRDRILTAEGFPAPFAQKWGPWKA